MATESFLFRQAYAPSPWTSPSVASLFTGLLVRDHELQRLGAGLTPEPPTIAERFAVGETAKDPSRERLLALYDEEVLAVDYVIGDLVALLRDRGVLERTVLAIVSDHGEEFLDHGGWRHGHHCFEEVSRGLLMIRFPNRAPAGETSVPVTMRDLPELLLERAGLEPLPGGGSRRLLALAESKADTAAAPIVVDHYPRFAGESPSFAVIDGRWKLLRHGTPGNEREWLFDLERSPDEHAATAEPAVHQRLANRLDEHLANRQVGSQPPVVGAVEDLRSLGYVQ